MIPRLYVAADLVPGGHMALDERSAHYLRNVLRRAVGDPVQVFNGRDGEYAAAISQCDKRLVELTLDGAKQREQESGTDIWLCFAPLKKDAVDFLVEKATELGVAAFHPVFTQNTAATRLNLDRLAANAIEASEQCERLTLPKVAEPVSLDQCLASWDNNRQILLCAEAGEALPMADALHRFTGTPSKPNSWAILCGPEGGFARTELDRLTKLPFVTPVGLGPRILRADTAALAALSIFQAVIGDGKLRPPQSIRPSR
jgi:16S rRNA (uracil1498-N3)-methyltransferase